MYLLRICLLLIYIKRINLKKKNFLHFVYPMYCTLNYYWAPPANNFLAGKFKFPYLK